MLELHTPSGLKAVVPQNDAEDPSTKFKIEDREAIAAYYKEHGYVIVRQAVSPAACQRIRDLWQSEIKPSQAFIYRQTTSKPEKHVLNDRGWVMNPILNVQSVDPVLYPKFREVAQNQILTAPGLAEGFSILFGEPPKIVQSMYFEGNAATQEHQDSYYLDSEKLGSMAAAWIALEDIDAESGRFFICPRSHLIDMGKQSSANNIADKHDEYLQSVVGKIRELGLEIRSPRLQQGDVLYWNAWTIHGSLDSPRPPSSRSSITCHAIPASHRFLQLQMRIVPLHTRRYNGIEVHHPKDLASPVNRAVLAVESRFPTAFHALKNFAIKTLVRLKNG